MFQAFAAGNPAYPTEYFHARAVATAAKTTYADTTNAVELLRFDLAALAGGSPPAPGVSTVPASGTGTSIGGSRGGLLKKLYAMPMATVTATQLILVSSVDGGNSYAIRGSAVMLAYTVATTTAVPYTPILDASGNAYSETNPLRLAPYEKLWFGIGVTLAGGIVCHAEGDGYA